MTNKKAKTKATADSSASLRNDKQKGKDRGDSGFPLGMTNQEGDSGFLRFAAE
jgi:hypothetical protein